MICHSQIASDRNHGRVIAGSERHLIIFNVSVTSAEGLNLAVAQTAIDMSQFGY